MMQCLDSEANSAQRALRMEQLLFGTFNLTALIRVVFDVLHQHLLDHLRLEDVTLGQMVHHHQNVVQILELLNPVEAADQGGKPN